MTFLFARLWQRSRVLTDAELIELRYSGRPAAALRLLKGVYFGVVFNAWSEISAMVTSGVVATWLELRHGEWLYSSKLCTTVAVTTVVWLVVTFATRPTADATLRGFVARIRPGSPGWRRITTTGDILVTPFLGPALRCWLVALVAFFALDFGVGSLLLQRPEQGAVLLVIAAAAAAVLGRMLRARSD